jgi:hypothetical protein
MAKSNDEIKSIVKNARDIVKEVYMNDERLKDKNIASDSGIARETDIVFKEVLRHLLNN